MKLIIGSHTLNMNYLVEILPKNTVYSLISFLETSLDKDKTKWIKINRILSKHRNKIHNSPPNAELIIFYKINNKLNQSYEISHNQLNIIGKNLTHAYSLEMIRARLLYNRISRYISSITVDEDKRVEYSSNIKSILDNLIGIKVRT